MVAKIATGGVEETKTNPVSLSSEIDQWRTTEDTADVADAKELNNTTPSQPLRRRSLIRKKLSRALLRSWTDSETRLESSDPERPHYGWNCYRQIPRETFHLSRDMVQEKELSRGGNQTANIGLQPAAAIYSPFVRFSLGGYMYSQFMAEWPFPGASSPNLS